ncbi:two component transcriptional regulator, winged helix family protein [Lentisphaera araneosa HTCC2155]|uniref:Two component transcriptional regulator, winged helix family protein n=1 Tax=Lentisphaera araneosa HTCC2155 TaxID=313628 RepID=A6DL07_9BACT|nr:response regulator [Lentisphaera araneosa]EDM27609.1 two component transcriptional regulator, winged helix family protein [Lentisphaera araneosa HTCC2155]
MRKILLVDDEPTVLKLTTMILERQNFEITSFDSPLKALEATDPNDYDLIISDLVMPKLNGLKFLKEIRNQAPDSKAIIISASADIARLQETDETDTQYLSKPFKFDELVDLINSVLE